MTQTSYRDMGDDTLAALYATAGEQAGAVLRELARRDRRDEQSRRDAARWAAVTEEWRLFAHAQYLAAEDACRGNLVRREYLGEIASGWDLWTGPRRWAWERATDELREFWDANRRVTVSEYREQQRRERRVNA